MIEIREDDFYGFCSELDVMLYMEGIDSTMNPLRAWDMICDTARGEYDG
mgnify:CR=1 FL=1|tara:strand:+ start:413 stop:559 length:147 start_codon:yes stop_codon:yes gene_type:complete